MAISKGRYELQASIEDTAAMLESLAIDINSYYKNKISTIEDNIKCTKENNPNEDFEILQSMTNMQEMEIEFYKEFQKEALEMLLIKVFSYAEKYFEILLSRLSYTRNKAIKEYSNDGEPRNNISDIEKFFYILKKHKKLSIIQITDIWNDYNNFHSLRKDIVHRSAPKKTINIEYINLNLSQISKLLMTIEADTRQ